MPVESTPRYRSHAIARLLDKHCIRFDTTAGRKTQFLPGRVMICIRPPNTETASSGATASVPEESAVNALTRSDGGCNVSGA